MEFIFSLYDNDLKLIVRELDSSKIPKQSSLKFTELINKSLDVESVTEIQMIHGESVMIMVAPLTEKRKGKVSIWGYILTLNPILKSSLQNLVSQENARSNGYFSLLF